MACQATWKGPWTRTQHQGWMPFQFVSAMSHSENNGQASYLGKTVQLQLGKGGGDRLRDLNLIGQCSPPPVLHWVMVSWKLYSWYSAHTCPLSLLQQLRCKARSRRS